MRFTHSYLDETITECIILGYNEWVNQIRSGEQFDKRECLKFNIRHPWIVPWETINEYSSASIQNAIIIRLVTNRKLFLTDDSNFTILWKGTEKEAFTSSGYRNNMPSHVCWRGRGFFKFILWFEAVKVWCIFFLLMLHLQYVKHAFRHTFLFVCI